MRRLATLCVGGLCLTASAGTPEGIGPQAPATPASPKRQAPTATANSKQQAPVPAAPKEPGSRYTVTLENLDRYIRYRQESDALMIGAMQAMTQEGSESGGFKVPLKKMRETDLTVREKHGLGGEDFQQLDQMVRDVSNARFMPESATFKALVQMNEHSAATATTAQERDMAKAMAAMVRKQMETEPQLREQRAQYGDTNVDLILSRESALKALWLRTDAEAAKMFDMLDQVPPGSISL
jgi:hypothetical protein